jgi:hypothetical protein
MTNAANIESFGSFSDGSGAEGIVSAFGFRFGFCYGSELVVNPLNRGNRFGNKAVAMYNGALMVAKEAFESAVAGLGEEWATKHTELYHPIVD